MRCTLTPYLFDLIGTRNSNVGSGKNYAITNIAALPTAFTDDFSPAALAAGVAQTFAAKEFPNVTKLGIQIITTVAGAGLSALSALLQCSNVGGTAAGCWADVATATACGNAVGSTFVTLATDMATARHVKFYRLMLTAADGAATVYAIAYGYNES